MDALRSRQTFTDRSGHGVAARRAVFSCLVAARRPDRARAPRGAVGALSHAPVARALSASVPAAVPPRAVSVPMLPFQDGKEVRVGDSVRGGRDGARPGGRGRPAGGRSRQSRRAADPLLRVRPAPVSSWCSSPSSGTVKPGWRRIYLP